MHFPRMSCAYRCGTRVMLAASLRSCGVYASSTVRARRILLAASFAWNMYIAAGMRQTCSSSYFRRPGVPILQHKFSRLRGAWQLESFASAKCACTSGGRPLLSNLREVYIGVRQVFPHRCSRHTLPASGTVCDEIVREAPLPGKGGSVF